LEADKLAKNLEQSPQVIREQLDILEHDKCVHVVKTFGPHYSAQILPKGLKYLEDVEGEPKPKPKGPIGFKSPKND
jgi:hypothetical protein